MLPASPATLNKKQRKLLQLFSKLNEQRQQQLLDFAEFLVENKTSEPAEKKPISEPLDIPRPDQESVVAAIKRLSKTYSMLNKDEVLHQTSDLMMAHVIKGQSAESVIDELEVLFSSHYEKIVSAQSDQSSSQVGE